MLGEDAKSEAGRAGIGTSRNANMSSGSGGAGRALAGSGAAGTQAGAGRAAPPDAGSSDGTQNPTTGPEGTCSDGAEQPCLVDGAPGNASEACKRGMRRCGGTSWGTCIGEPMPDAEQCNDLDDDCDGKVDEYTDSPCYADGQMGCTKSPEGVWSCVGTCALGTRPCTQGKLGDCSGYKLPSAEKCTEAGMVGSDENCNGMTDESCACTAGETRSCYVDGSMLEVGKCKAGRQTCSGGMLGPCTGAVTAGTESCGNPNVDDDCNGTPDDIRDLGAQCVVAGNTGPCRSGTMQCEDKAELQCVPNKAQPEVCNGLDDDCNGTLDDGFDLKSDSKNCGRCGMTCAADGGCCGGKCADFQADDENCGRCGNKCQGNRRCSGGECRHREPDACRPACGSGETCAEGTCVPVVTPGMCQPACGAGQTCNDGKCVPVMMPGTCQPACGADEKCMDGKCVPVMTMPAGCQPACGSGQTCCDGSCVDVQSDVKNCGQCGRVCRGGMQPGCCKGACVELVSDGNCGSCGRDCSLLSSGGITCTCTKGGDGRIVCAGPLLNLCL